MQTLHQRPKLYQLTQAPKMSIKISPKSSATLTASVVFDHGGYAVTLSQIKGVNRGRYTTAVASQPGRTKLYAHGPNLTQAIELIKRLIDENQLVPTGLPLSQTKGLKLS
jgi:hypothetical protein